MSNAQNAELKCPRCGSNQLTTNKKGFSGKKAVAGAVLTGGIGILAGTLGSNKIKITCLACGKEFKPGEDLDSLRRRKQVEAQAMNSPVFWIILIVVAVLVIVAFKSCINNSKAVEDSSVSKSTNDTESTTTPNILTEFKSYYNIEKENTDQGNISLMVYISNTAKLYDINLGLIQQYDPKRDQYIQIYYFTKKDVGATYLDKQTSDDVSEKEKNKLFKYLYAVYRYNPSTGYDNMNLEH